MSDRLTIRLVGGPLDGRTLVDVPALCECGNCDGAPIAAGGALVANDGERYVLQEGLDRAVHVPRPEHAVRALLAATFARASA